MPPSLEQCLERLVEVFGHRYPATRGGGLTAMSAELHKRFGLSGSQADSLLREMEQARLIEYCQPADPLIGADPDRYRDSQAPPTTYLLMDLPGSVVVQPPAGAFVAGQGYWRIGQG